MNEGLKGDSRLGVQALDRWSGISPDGEGCMGAAVQVCEVSVPVTRLQETQFWRRLQAGDRNLGILA